MKATASFKTLALVMAVLVMSITVSVSAETTIGPSTDISKGVTITDSGTGGGQGEGGTIGKEGSDGKKVEGATDKIDGETKVVASTVDRKFIAGKVVDKVMDQVLNLKPRIQYVEVEKIIEKVVEKIVPQIVYVETIKEVEVPVYVDRIVEIVKVVIETVVEVKTVTVEKIVEKNKCFDTLFTLELLRPDTTVSRSILVTYPDGTVEKFDSHPSGQDGWMFIGEFSFSDLSKVKIMSAMNNGDTGEIHATGFFRLGVDTTATSWTIPLEDSSGVTSSGVTKLDCGLMDFTDGTANDAILRITPVKREVTCQ